MPRRDWHAGQVEARKAPGRGCMARRCPRDSTRIRLHRDARREVLPRGGTSFALARSTKQETSDRHRRNRMASPATRTLPLRIATRLAVGKPKRVRARNANGRGRYRTVAPSEPAGSIRAHDPAAGPAHHAWRQSARQCGDRGLGAGEAPAAELAPGEHDPDDAGPGRFRLAGRFGRPVPDAAGSVTPGTATIRSRSAQVELGVRAKTTIGRSESGSSTGRRSGSTDVCGAGRPARRARLLLHPGLHRRGRWSTLATPRANRVTGLWSEPIGSAPREAWCATDSGSMIPREASFPYETGRTRSVRVHRPRAMRMPQLSCLDERILRLDESSSVASLVRQRENGDGRRVHRPRRNLLCRVPAAAGTAWARSRSDRTPSALGDPVRGSAFEGPRHDRSVALRDIATSTRQSLRGQPGPTGPAGPPRPVA